MTQQDIHPETTRATPGETAPEPPAHQWFGTPEHSAESAAPTTGIPTQAPEQGGQPGEPATAPDSGRSFPSYGFGTPDAHQQRTDWYATQPTPGTGGSGGYPTNPPATPTPTPAPKAKPNR